VQSNNLISSVTQKNYFAQELHSDDAISSPVSLWQIKRRAIRYLDARFRSYRTASRKDYR